MAALTIRRIGHRLCCASLPRPKRTRVWRGGCWRSPMRFRRHEPEGGGAGGRHGSPDAAGLGHPLQRARHRWPLDRWDDGRPPRLEPDEQAELSASCLRVPIRRSGLSAFTREDLVRICEARFGKTFHPASLGRLLKRLGLSRQKARPSHPKKDPARRQRPLKRAPALLETISTHIKASACACSSRTRPASVRRAACATSGGSAASVRQASATSASPSPTSSRPSSPAPTMLSRCVALRRTRTAMQEFLDQFAATIGRDEHAVMVLDQAGWHGSDALRCQPTSRSCRCPPTRPNSTRSSGCGCISRSASSRIGCTTTTTPSLTPPATPGTGSCAEAGRIRSLCSYPWILAVSV